MKTSDVVIIGGGIAGVSLAAKLAGRMSVTLLETESMPGYHATGRSAAVFVPNYGGGPIRELSRQSRPHFDAPDPEYWPTRLFKHRGLLRVVRPDGRDAYAAQSAGAAGVEPIQVAEARRMFPPLDSGRFAEASYEDDVHDIDVDALLQGYLRMARKEGARIETGRQVETLAREADGWTATAGGERYAAPLIINAAGAWADHIAHLAGLPRAGLTPCRRSVAVLPLPGEIGDPEAMPFVVPFPLGWYAKAEAGRLLISAGEEHPAEPHDAFADDMVLAEGLHRFSEDTTVEVRRVESSWAGLRTFSPDGNPLVGRDPREDSFFWFAGQGGFGIQTAPAMAEIAAACILEGSAVPEALRAERIEGFRAAG